MPFAFRFVWSAWLVLLGSNPWVFASDSQRLSLQVRETAGIRRFGYPVTVTLQFDPAVPDGTRFRLMHTGKPQLAQFRPTARATDRISEVTLDFDSNFMPFEKREYEVEFGEALQAGPEPEPGWKVEDSGNAFVLANGPHLVWTVPKDLSHWIRSIKTPKLEYLRDDSAGLSIRMQDGQTSRLSDSTQWQVAGKIAKQGPIDCLLRFEGKGRTESNGDIAWAIELGFPRSKSWVRFVWELEDRSGKVSGVSAELNLRLGDGPTLADFGVGETAYAVVSNGQVSVLESGGGDGAAAWRILRGRPEDPEPYVIAKPDEPRCDRAWVHAMDRERCTALALDDFGRMGHDRIEIASDGRLGVFRSFASGGDRANRKQLCVWAHFVPFPPHVGAVTSPQSMQAPLEVQYRRLGQ